jgi:hypothetical protein
LHQFSRTFQSSPEEPTVLTRKSNIPPLPTKFKIKSLNAQDIVFRNLNQTPNKLPSLPTRNKIHFTTIDDRRLSTKNHNDVSLDFARELAPQTRLVTETAEESDLQSVRNKVKQIA